MPAPAASAASATPTFPATPAVQRFDLPVPAPGTSASYPLMIQIEKTPDPDGVQTFTAVSTFAVPAAARHAAVGLGAASAGAPGVDPFDHGRERIFIPA